MRHVHCNVCGADDFVVLFDKGRGTGVSQRIVRCKRCTLMYANPQEIVDCEEYERPGSFEEYDQKTLSSPFSYCRKQQVQLPDNLRVLDVLNREFPQRGRLLEIGSFMGIFLDQIRAAGWDCIGLEPNRGGAKYCREKFGLKVINSVLPCPEFEPASLDAVIMLHVIEHMPDPAASVGEIRRLLRAGGVLVVETPRFDSLMFRLLGSRERSMNNCPGHIYFFTRLTLRRLLEDNGFSVFRQDLVGRTLTMDRLVYNVGLVTQSPRMQRVLTRISRGLRLDRLRLHVNVRDMQRVYCRAV